MGALWTARFWKDAAERGIKTFAQALAAALSAGATGILTVQWLDALSIAGMAALLSVLMSVGSLNVGEKGTGSMLPVPAAPPERAPQAAERVPQAAGTTAA